MIDLDFPKQDGILLTKKGLMKISYFKELVVAKPLGKTEEANKTLQEFLRKRLMAELVKDLANLRGITSTSNSPMFPEQGSSSEMASAAQTLSESSTPTKTTEAEPSTKAQKSSPTESSPWTLPPLLSQWTDMVLDILSRNPEKIGRKMGKIDLEMRPSLFMGNHPMIHRTVLHRMVRFLRSAYRDHKNEDILVLHREQHSHPSSRGDGDRYILQPKDVLLLLPTTLSQSTAHLRFELGTHFCRSCKTTETVNPAELRPVCICGTPLEILRCMGTIHSHGSLSAFSSGTDNKYEIPHIGFHMTAGNLDQPQESLVLSFCDGEVRIPLNVGDLFAIEKEDASFDGQINNWLLVRSRKKEEAAKKQPKVQSKESHYTPWTEADWDRYRSTRKRFHGESVFDDSLAMTRTENDVAPKEIVATDPDEDRLIIAEALDAVENDKRSWVSAVSLIRRLMWNLDDTGIVEVLTRVEDSLKAMSTADFDYSVVAMLLTDIKVAAEYAEQEQEFRL